MTGKRIKKDTDQRPFSMVYHDFLESKKLSEHEKMVFIALKKFADSNNQCFPSLEKLSNIARISKRKVRDTLRELEQKHIISIESRLRADGGKTSNLYTIRDFKELWNVENNKEVTTIINEYEEMKLISELQSRGYTVIKEKEPTSIPSKVEDVSPQYQTDIPIYTTKTSESQAPEDLERYTMDDIKQFFEYDILIIDHSERKKDIDIVFTILYDTLNCTKPSIRVDGQEKPSMIVISKLMKLEQADLWYAIEKYHAQRERIKNVNAYLLTILYHVKEQSYLDLMNLGHYNGHF